MYNTANMGPKKERWKEPITVKHTKKVYYNAYAGGYGAHGKDKKAIHKADRKKWKKECKEYSNI